MKVILREDVDHLGFAGDVVDVRKGYWRNYLGPRGFAEVATDAKITAMLERMERRRAAQARNKEEASELQALLNRTVITVEARASEAGKLFGSVGPAEVSRQIERARKMRVDEKKIRLEDPIKEVGTAMVSIDVFEGVTAEVKVIVTAIEDDEIVERESIIEEVIADEAKAEADTEDAESATDEASDDQSEA